MEDIINKFVSWISNNWPVISAAALAISSIVVFWKNILTIRKLRMDIDCIQQANKEKDSLIRKATLEELEKYAWRPFYGELREEGFFTILLKTIHHYSELKKEGGGIFLLVKYGHFILIVGLLIYLIGTSYFFWYSLLALSLFMMSYSFVIRNIRQREFYRKSNLFSKDLNELYELYSKENPNNE